MKVENSTSTQILDRTIYRRRSKRGWSIVIMPDNIRIDNFHGFPHVHLEGKGGHEEIKTNDFKTVHQIVIKHLERNKGVNKKELKRELVI
jgi:hypothetical protein